MGKLKQYGNLVVTGCSKVVIHLQDLPHNIEVHFKHNNPVPCDSKPIKHDKLSYVVRKHYGNCKSRYTLTIKWKVHGIREIFWNAYFC